MGGKRAAGLVLMVIGVAAALWGLKGESLESQNPAVIVSGGVLILIGLVMAAKGDSTAPAFQGKQFAGPKEPPSAALLANLVAESPMIAANFPNQGLLADVVGQIQEGYKINAIKTLREHTRCGLKEGKDLVDEIERVMKGAARS